MNAKKCDRCGSFYEEGDASKTEAFAGLADAFVSMIYNKPPQPYLNNDLCKECEKSFKKWWEMKGEQTTPKQKNFKIGSEK